MRLLFVLAATACVLSLGLAVAQSIQEEAIALDSPRDFQVFQRPAEASGDIRVSGRATVSFDRAEVRITGNSTFGEIAGDWQPLPAHAPSPRIEGSVNVPAGGWYRFELRLLRDGKPIAVVQVAHTAVGEVFIVAGQSNATNYGEVRQQTRTSMVSAWSPHEWRLANDPQPAVQDSSQKGSFVPAFGDALFERFHVPIGVADVGCGSTSVRQWLPAGDRFDTPPTMGKFVTRTPDDRWVSDGTLFNGMMKAINLLGRGGFRALLWHQGESDAHQKPPFNIAPEAYRALLEHVIRASREQAGWDFPWFVAQVSYHSAQDPSAPEIRAAQASLWRSGLAFEGPDTDRLTGEYRQDDGRGVHMSNAGLQAHGNLWAAKVGDYIEKVLR